MENPPSLNKIKVDPLYLHQLPVSVDVQPIVAKYYCVTKEQLDEYADLGFFTSFFLVLFGIALGVVTTCWGALTLGALSPMAIVTFQTALWASVISGVVFLLSAILFYSRQRGRKRTWIIAANKPSPMT